MCQMLVRTEWELHMAKLAGASGELELEVPPEAGGLGLIRAGGGVGQVRE